MDFNSLVNGSPFYILRKVAGQKPVLEQGVVKEKTIPQPKYQPQGVPNAFNGMGMQHVTSITVSINGNDRIIADLPANIEIAARGNETYSASREAIMQAVDTMVQASKKHIADVSYNEMCIAEGEKMMEVLNPNYAEEKMRAQSIKDLQARSDEQDKKLAALERQSSEMLSILRQLNGGPSAPKPAKS